MHTNIPRKKRSTFEKVCLGILVAFGFSVLTSLPASAVDGPTLTQLKVPERGYYLAGDMFEYSWACPEGQNIDVESPELDYKLGGSGGGWFGMDLGFDSEPGMYEVVLTCIDRETGEKETDSFEFEVRPSMELIASVGTVADECATTTEISVPAGTEVFWCYELRVVPEVVFGAPDPSYVANHSITDSLPGVGIDRFDTENLTTGTVISTIARGITRSSVVHTPIVNDVSWTKTLFSDGKEESTFTIRAQAIVNIAETPVPDPEDGETPTVTDPDGHEVPTATDPDDEKSISDEEEPNHDPGSGLNESPSTNERPVSNRPTPVPAVAAVAAKLQPHFTG